MSESLPTELEQLLQADSQAKSVFEAMPPSHRRQYADYVGEAKRSETRQLRAQNSLKLIKEWPKRKQAGYSDKPLVDKLGIKAGMRVAIIKAPANYDRLIGQWPVGVSVSRQLRGEYDFIHYFVKNQSVLEAVFANLATQLDKAGLLWVSWPKMASGSVTDLNENIVRSLGLRAGLVDVKVAAIDDTWSGLKFVYRSKDR